MFLAIFSLMIAMRFGYQERGRTASSVLLCPAS